MANEVLRRAGTQRSMMAMLVERQQRGLEHVMKETQKEKLVLTRRVEDTRARRKKKNKE